MKTLLPFAAVCEAATGLVLAVYPPIVVQLLFGADVAGAGIVMSRIAGIALIGLGLACWPGPALLGILAYSALAMLYLAYLGFEGEWAGKLLWPAVAGHAVLAILLAREWGESRRGSGGEGLERR